VNLFPLRISLGKNAAAWEMPAKAQGWTTQTIPNVEIRMGDTIAVQMQGAPARLDYVQLNAK
jgi:hypothetical protein